MVRIGINGLVAAAAFSALGAQAEAGTITTLTFGGTVNSIYDGSGLFGPTGTSYSSGSFSGTITYTPPSATCNSSNCTYSLSGTNALVETLTFNSHTVTFDASSAGIRFNQYAPQQITFSSVSGTGFSFSSEQFQDSSTFFGASPYNLSAALSFATTAISGTGSGTDGSTSIGLSFTSISAMTTSVVMAVPEPMSLALLGVGLAGVGFVRCRARRPG